MEASQNDVAQVPEPTADQAMREALQRVAIERVAAQEARACAEKQKAELEAVEVAHQLRRKRRDARIEDAAAAAIASAPRDHRNAFGREFRDRLAGLCDADLDDDATLEGLAADVLFDLDSRAQEALSARQAWATQQQHAAQQRAAQQQAEQQQAWIPWRNQRVSEVLWAVAQELRWLGVWDPWLSSAMSSVQQTVVALDDVSLRGPLWSTYIGRLAACRALGWAAPTPAWIWTQQGWRPAAPGE